MSKLTIEIDSEQSLDNLKVKVDDVPINLVAAIHLNGFSSECECSIILLDANQPDTHGKYLTALNQLSKFKHLIHIKTMRLY